MKRKCYALLALLLAVCMVLPMGVFVGAADGETPKEPVWTVKVSGAIDENGKTKAEYEIKDGNTVYVAANGTVTINASLTENYTVISASANDMGVFSLDKTNISSGVIKATGIKVGEDTIKITAADANRKNEKYFYVKVKVAENQILGVRVTVPYNSNPVEDKGTLSFAPGNTINEKDIHVEARFSDQQDQTMWQAIPDATVTISMYNKVTQESRSGENGVITVRGGDETLTCTVTIPNYKTEVIECTTYVSGGGITSLTIQGEPKSGDNFSNESTIALKDVKERTIVTVVSDNSTSTITSGFECHWFESAHPNENIDIQTIKAKDAGKYKYYVVYEGVKSDPIPVSDAIKVQQKNISRVEMDVSNAEKKDYFETQTLNDFRGIVVTITYDDGKTESITGDDIKKLNLYIEPFSADKKWISIQYGSLKPETVDVSKMNISKKTVMGIEAITTGVKLKYNVGEKLKLDGLTIKIKYNVGEPELKKYTDTGIECYPKNGSTITADTKDVAIYYTVNGVSYPAVIKLSLTNTKMLTSVRLRDSSNKTSYFVGEKFQPKNYRVELYYNNEANNSETLYLDSSKLTVTYKLEDETTTSTIPTFSTASNGYITVVIKRTDCAGEATLQIPVTVTKRPNLKSISATFVKKDVKGYVDGYYVGDMPSVLDFNFNVLYDDGSSRTFPISESDSGYYKNTPYNYTKTDENKIVYYTLKLTPTKIEEDTKTIRIAYTERVTLNGSSTTNTVYTDVEIKVTIPDCILTHYESRSSRKFETIPYESLYDALHDASDYDEIQLCRDVTMSTDYASDKTLEIDLNGHTLTMVRGEIYVRSNASSNVKITFSNSSRDDAHIRYTTKEDEDIIIAYNKEYVIDRSSKNDGRYDITITSVKNGKVTGPTEVIHGHDAKFTITPDEGYEIAAIKVNNKTYKAASDNTLLIEDVREKLTVTVTFQEKAWQNPFTDVSKYATYYKAVQFVYEEGLFNGTSATKFEPDTTMTRAMFVTVLGRLAGVNVNNYKTSSFSDVATGQWYSEYVEWASSIGLVEGYGNGKFGPNDSITHAQMYVLMERYADIIEGKNTTASGTSISANDVRDIPDWAYEAVEYAAKSDFLVVSSYRLTPNDNAKRSELAMLLQKFCKNVLGY